MNGARRPQPPANGAAVNGVKKVVKKKNNANVFMSTNNRIQNRFQDKVIKPGSSFKHLDQKGESGKALRSQEQPLPARAPQVDTLFKDVPIEQRTSGFSDPRVRQPGSQYKDYKLVTTKRDLLKDLRYHLMQLSGNKVDIRNDHDFTQPAHLNRRNILAETLGTGDAKVEEIKSELDPEQRADLQSRKEQRARERAANLAEMAPNQQTKKINNFKGTAQVYQRTDFTEEERRAIQNNYEEALPWVLEDYDTKHTFISAHQQGAYGTEVALAREPAPDGTQERFRLVPIEKIYEFKPKPKIYNNMTQEEIAAAFKRGAVDPEWLKERKRLRKKEDDLEKQYKTEAGVFSGGVGARSFGRGVHRKGEEGDLDFEDDFADDEEGNLFGEEDEEEQNDIKKRIKEDQLQANIFDTRDQAEDDADENQEQKEADARKQYTKSFKKKLEKREKNFNYGSDSEEGETTGTDSEAERARQQQEKLNNDKKEEDGIDGKKSAMSSGANTPSGRREKHSSGREDGPKKGLKRSGSPLSDASGTDVSTRKKRSKKHHLRDAAGPSRAISPDNLDPASAASRQSRASFTSNPAGSDTDAAAMSDGAKSGIKLKLGIKKEPGLSPPTSRAASPVPRPASTGPGPSPPLPTLEDLKDAIPKEGIPHKDLFNMFPALKAAMKNDRKPEMLKLVKAAGSIREGRFYLFDGTGASPAMGASEPAAGSASG